LFFFGPRAISLGIIIKAASTHVLFAMYKFAKRLRDLWFLWEVKNAKSLLGGQKK
jgi:hypothetical protein